MPRRPVASLVLLASLTFLSGLGRQAIADADEGFYAEASREMVETGDWLTPRFNYTDRWQKPVLYYWLTAAIYRLVGPNEWAARFWAALSGIGLVLLTWRIGGRGAPGWLAAAIVATCYGYFAMARTALPDLPLAFCITLGMWAALESRWALAGAAVGLGFLMKGPVALVIPAIVLLPIWWREGTLTRLSVRDLAVAAAIFTAVGLPWYAAMTAEHGVAYLQSFFLADNLERFATDRFNEPRAVWFYLPIVAGGMVPWSAYLLVLSRRGIRDWIVRRRHLTPEEWRLLLWASLPLLFYTLSVGKQPRYILPVLPPLAILLSRMLLHRLERTDEPESTRDLRIATWITAVFYFLLAVLLIRARPLFITAYPPATWLAVAGIVAGSLVLGWIAATNRWSRLPAAMVVSAMVLLLGVQFGVLSGRRPEPVETMAALVRAHRSGGESVGEYQVFVRNLVFYTGFAHADLFDEGRALDFVRSSDRVLLVVRSHDLERLETVSGLTLTRLGQVQYIDPATIRLRTLFWPMPSQDLEVIVLVTNKS